MMQTFAGGDSNVALYDTVTDLSRREQIRGSGLGLPWTVKDSSKETIESTAQSLYAPVICSKSLYNHVCSNCDRSLMREDFQGLFPILRGKYCGKAVGLDLVSNNWGKRTRPVRRLRGHLVMDVRVRAHGGPGRGVGRRSNAY
ncbi:hypothetical protein EVAR_92714_1 [Eumeta japonica]|uniref:Uncharacterized protein n=1 Tax=Eumeta variegata TaxID=151549 RepID=A0A4C1SZT9_EUMVA|nr:hypothetical protein EVAR_92714_1 [Eumeta japonica]